MDLYGNVLVTGYTMADWVMFGGFDTTRESVDAFVVKFDTAGVLVWATYLGGSQWDEGLGIAVDPSGNVLVTGRTDSPAWASGGYDTTYDGNFDAFVAKISDFMQPTVVGRHVFYNNSYWDTPSAEHPTATDNDAIAADKTALLPGQTATAANYTSYSRGINGIMVDVASRPAGYTPVAGDFTFRVGNDSDPAGAGWTDAPVPVSVTRHDWQGVSGSTRVKIVWDDYAIRSQWLEVTVLATPLGLQSDDVFYFGNAPGEAGNTAANAEVSTTDLLLARSNPQTFLDRAGITDAYDFNRDSLVDTTDILQARNNQTNFLNALKLITPTVAPGEVMAAPAVDAPSPPAPLSAFRARGELAADAALVEQLAWLYDVQRLLAERTATPKAAETPGTVDQLLIDWPQ